MRSYTIPPATLALYLLRKSLEKSPRPLGGRRREGEGHQEEPIGKPFHPDELALIVDHSGRRYLIRLRSDAEFHFHHGIIKHNAILDHDEGVHLATTLGKPAWAYRPRMQDYVIEMPRSSAIIYPKDIAFILMWADIFPGASVFEAGVGSGALAIGILRAIGPTGQLVSYETRPDMMEAARRNASGFLGETPNWTIRLKDAYESIDDGPFDRVVLDLPEPGRVAQQICRALVPGGLVCAYVPNVTQIQASAEAYGASGFGEIECYETLFRPWEFRGPTARPVRSMISHTGFLMFARRRPSAALAP